MKTTLFVMLPVVSHYNACFGLAATLREQGDRVCLQVRPICVITLSVRTLGLSRCGIWKNT